MKVISRASILGCLLLALLLVPGLAAHAQNANCFGLRADDCALLQAALGASKPTSFNMAYELTVNASGPKGRTLDLSLKGSGPFEYDGDMTNVAAQDAVQKVTMQNTVATSVTADGKTTTGNLEFRILNGTLYINGDNVTQGKWRSIDLSQAVTQMRSRNAGARNLNPATVLALVQAAQKLAAIPGFVKVERAADTTLENQQIANYVYHFDLPVLFNSTEFETFLKDVLARTPNGSRLNEAVLNALGARLAQAFKDTTLTVTRLVGVTDKVTHGFGIDLALKLDPKTLPAGVAGMVPALGTPDPTAQPVSANVHYLMTLSGIGSKANVVAPEGATPFNLPAATGTPEANQ